MRKGKRVQRTPGFSFLEVMISMTLILIMILSYTFLSSFIGKSGTVSAVVDASNLARAKLEFYRSQPPDDPGLTLASEETLVDDSSSPNYTVVTQVSRDYRGVTGLKMYSISVFKKGENRLADPRPLVDNFTYYKVRGGI